MEWLRISTSTKLVRVQTDDIVYIEADGNYSYVHLCNGKKHTMTLQLHFFDESFQRLKNNFFVRVGRSLIVNKNYIHIINLTEQKMILTGGKLADEYKVPAPKDALKELKAKLEEENLPAWLKESEQNEAKGGES